MTQWVSGSRAVLLDLDAAASVCLPGGSPRCVVDPSLGLLVPSDAPLHADNDGRTQSDQWLASHCRRRPTPRCRERVIDERSGNEGTMSQRSTGHRSLSRAHLLATRTRLSIHIAFLAHRDIINSRTIYLWSVRLLITGGVREWLFPFHILTHCSSDRMLFV